MKPLRDRRIVILVADDYEDLELWYPCLRLREAGASVVVAGPEARKTYRGKHGYPCPADRAIAEIHANQFDGIVIPGGWMPDLLRRDPQVLQLVRDFASSAKLVASICHGPSINISAGVARGVKMTSSTGIKDDLLHAGAQWTDAPVVVDRHYVSSRRPADLPDFCEAIIQVLQARKL
jgi:protease I